MFQKKMNKKIGGLILGLLLVMSFVVTVSAPPLSPSGLDKVNNGDSNGNADPTGIIGIVGSVIDGVYQILKPVLEKVLVGETAGTDTFLMKLLFMIIVFAVSWKVMEKMPVLSDTSWVPVVVGIAISLLSIRFMDADLIKTMLLPYTIYGVALTSILPFIIYFFATMDMNHTARKIAWIFFAVIFVFVYFTRQAELGATAIMYLVAFVLAIIALLGDPLIHKIRTKGKIEKIHNVANRKRAIALNEERDAMTTRYHKNPDEYKPVYSDKPKGRAAYLDDLKHIDLLIADLER